MTVLSNEELTNMFLNSVVTLRPDFFIEVGCFEASASIYVSSKLPECNVYAYEANPHNYSNFKDQLLQYNFNYVNKAISDFHGTTQFYLQKLKKKNKNKNKHVRGNNSLLKRTDRKVEYEEVSVNCNTLDNLHYQEDSTYALWIDAEGKGFEVLTGSEQILKKTKLLLIEVESIRHWKEQLLDYDVIALLTMHGFKQIYRDQEYPEQYNILFEKV